jgi:hypothetical protein
MIKQDHFSDDQLTCLQATLRRAEECLEAFYCFSPREWFHYSFEILTARDLPADFPDRPEKVLGEIQKKSGPNLALPALPEPAAMYSIILFDGNILHHLRERPQVRFDHLLLYILTHELVHLARFFHLIDYDLPDCERIREEQKVHRLTGRILCRMGDPALMALTEVYLSEEFSL